MGRSLPTASGEYVVADLPDCLVNVPESLHDAAPVRLVGQVQGGLQAEADIEKVADDPVEQFLAEVRWPRSGSSVRCWLPGGDGRLPGRINRDLGIESIKAQDATDDLGGRYQPQLRAGGDNTLIRTHQGIRASVITRGCCSHIHDQCRGAAVDDRQQLLTDRASIRQVNMVRKPHNRLTAHPLHRVTIFKHASNVGMPDQELQGPNRARQI
jgi:hypothetical protein